MNNVFFDIDGTLHKEDIFFEFIKYSIFKKKIRVLLLLPIFLLSFIIYLLNKRSKIGINMILYALFFGAKNKEVFISQFCQQVRISKNEKIFNILNSHIANGNIVFLISGTPEIFINYIYFDILEHKNVILIGSEISFGLNSMYLVNRCFFKKKLELLDQKTKTTVYFLEGYTDSKFDIPILERCSCKFFVLKNGDFVGVG